MTEDTLKHFTQQYISCQPESLKELHFSWQGGEPTLLGVEFFKHAVKLQNQYARPGMKILNSFQTNGTLLNSEWGKFLHDESFLVGLSLDGPEKIHNTYRLDKHGKGSFNETMRGLEILHKHQVEFNTLTVVNNINGNHPELVYEFLKKHGSSFFQFIPIVEREDDSLRRESVGPRQWGRFLQRIFDLWLSADIGEIFVQFFDVFLGLYMGMPSALCVHSETCGRAAALEHNGDLFSCDHFVFTEYFLGNIHSYSLTELMDGAKQAQFGHDKKSLLPGFCKKCRYVQLCQGGCPGHRFMRAPGGEVGLNYLCEGYKLFFKHSLPYFHAMASCLGAGRPAKDFHHFMSSASNPPTKPPGRNDFCTCGSKKKYKNCCGR